MPNKKKSSVDDFDEANAKALLEMIADPVTPEPVRLQIINEILEQTKDNSFFETMYKENMTLSRCPYCSHENHWLIPEDELNIMGHVSAEKDPRVKFQTTSEDCPQFQESCSKKKITA